MPRPQSAAAAKHGNEMESSQKSESDAVQQKNPGQIRCKVRRTGLYQKYKAMKKKEKKARRKDNKRAAQAVEGEEAPPRKVPKTIESQRVNDVTIVDPEDEEVLKSESLDEMASYFAGRHPNVLVTTSQRAVSKQTFSFCEELINVIPDAEFYNRKKYGLKEIVSITTRLGFTDIVVVNEDRKVPNSLLLTHLPEGPTIHFKVSSVKIGKSIKNHARQTSHRPELILNHFDTRLGRRISRVIGSLFPQDPQYLGRQVVTFHNQRDYIFFRRHRYIFKDGKRVGLQEIGPRFTLKVRSVQKGTFDSINGEYEFVHNNKLHATNRRRFLL